jgi:hypothetical protein
MELVGQELRGISSKLSTEETNAIFKKVKALLSKKSHWSKQSGGQQGQERKNVRGSLKG